MRASLIVTLVVTFFTSLAISAETEQKVEVLAWPLSESKPQTYAKISYNSTHATVSSSKGIKVPPGDDIVRIGFHHDGGAWSGVATAASNVGPGKDKKILLHLNTNGELYHIGFKTSDYSSRIKAGSGKDRIEAEIVNMQRGPAPHLNKPVVLNAEGQVEGKEPEKTFLQK